MSRRLSTTPHAASTGTAVLVVDMQNGFCTDGGSLAPHAEVRARYQALTTVIGELCATARASGLPVVYTVHGYRAGYPEAGSEIASLHPEVAHAGGMLWGGWDTAIVAAIEPDARDYIVRKSRFDAFLGTDLELLLDGLGVSQLVVAGVSTNVCVESTVRSASQRGYAVAVAADATAASTTALHDEALRAIGYAFARVATWRELLASPAP